MPLVPLRLLPDADDVVRDILAATGLPVMVNIPADLFDRMPVVVVSRFSGGAVRVGLLDRATFSVDCYASTRREAADAAETCRVLLFRAWRNQTIHAGASIALYAEVTAPSELRGEGQADQIYRYNSTVSLHIRP